MAFEPKFDTLNQIFEHSTTTHADRPLFGTKDGGQWHWMSYGTFRKKVDAFRAGLAELGIGPGDRVAVISNNRPEWAIGAYATYGLGATYVPMYEAQLDKDWHYILADSGASAVLVPNGEVRDRVLGFRSELFELGHVIVMNGDANEASVSMGEIACDGESKTHDVEDCKASDMAGLIYTSGTTGDPKGVRLSHGNIAHNLCAVFSVFTELGPEDRSLSFLPWAHSFGQTVELNGFFSLGASLGIAESVDKIVENLGEVKPTVIMSVPRIFNRIYDSVHKKMNEAGGMKKSLFEATLSNAAKRRELADQGKSSGWVNFKYNILDSMVSSKVRQRFGGKLKFAISGGAALSKDVGEFIDSLGIQVYEGYGLSETSPIVSANYPGHRKIGSVGKPIPGVDVKLSKDGELIVYGHNVMMGYHHLEEETEKVIDKDGGFHTGDMARIDDDGFIFITGRIKEQYKLENGKYVVPSPLEEKLKLSPYISNIMIYGDNRPYNVALIVPDMESLTDWAKDQGIAEDALLTDAKVKTLFEQQIKEYGSAFKHYERPRTFSLLAQDFTPDNDMLTPTLKLKRRVVINHYDDTLNSLY